MNNNTTIILKKHFLCPDLIELHIQKPTDFTFLAGQFVQFMIPDGENTAPRSYSITSPPSQHELVFVIKLIPGGKAGEYLKTIEVGDSLDIRGPLGHFVHKEPSSMTCIATGVGITPIMSLIEDELVTKKTNTPIRLIFGFRHAENIFWIEKLDKLTKQYSNFSYTLTLSQADDAWTGARGRVTEHLPEVDESEHIYICGNPHMVKDVRDRYLEQGVESKQVHFEIF
ncbi:hypothetical protein KKG22_02305 [Patescibacteria group bacterium]|nr:hypothetical protein [Patescibacteria group bacterium]MBU1721816.1 hypothetical protein [Patescibacteria group bacterium]MBU1901690.1 hypothetical protein [Patescibacteria group bacterium]